MTTAIMTSENVEFDPGKRKALISYSHSSFNCIINLKQSHNELFNFFFPLCFIVVKRKSFFLTTEQEEKEKGLKSFSFFNCLEQ